MFRRGRSKFSEVIAENTRRYRDHPVSQSKDIKDNLLGELFDEACKGIEDFSNTNGEGSLKIRLKETRPLTERQKGEMVVKVAGLLEQREGFITAINLEDLSILVSWEHLMDEPDR